MTQHDSARVDVARNGEPRALFFYGTLMHPGVLERVIGHAVDKLTFTDAVLYEHTRHHVRHADYPAVIPIQSAQKLIGRALDREEASVRGTIVQGLSPSDVDLLDVFEGDEYVRRTVQAHILSAARTGAIKGAEALVPLLSPIDLSQATQDQTQSVDVYLWSASVDRLESGLWDFAAFLKDKSHRWVGTSQDEEEFAEVDRRRAMNGKITPDRTGGSAGGPAENTLPVFGKALGRQYWTFGNYINLNAGSYGACPQPVVKQTHYWRERTEAAPDKVMKRDYAPVYTRTRARLAKLFNCDVEDLAVVGNTTISTNAILRSFPWQKGDKILHVGSTIYDPARNTLQYIIDSRPDLELSMLDVQVNYPLSDKALLDAFERMIVRENGAVRFAFFDGISSQPGVALPWQSLVSLCKRHNVVSFVDGAHEPGQRPIDLKSAQPDFFAGNLHKWLYAHRPAGMLYADKRWHTLVQPFPIAFAYIPIAQGRATFAAGWDWPATEDISRYLSIETALDFREMLGGEQRIQTYTHGLAMRGGRRMAEILGTEVLENEEGTLTASMVNVRLPVDFASVDDFNKQKNAIRDILFDEYDCFAPCFFHNGKTYVRASAQVFNDLTDFEYVAIAYLEICRNIK
ncbi:uncharacterized protein L969DRAFT_86671 [Mixia osmundae IAM 14324]|uniref:Aminotransferase class V domain-containing protein n=1 Tax=Mixia osmundae (strain CBS 9802 / IAM 14324 / JCM 22182 / KY 12970) TaxID=764103 RepID=G7E9V7_MIXOS|nr:uncharacterized protein L969DRAFT_86671 [Mixia osmundae IAM 14324]KEI40058.1 hypothetical protein L969DRAFT_86671 [Mixia osmundae IAM 14324]GAA99426.1 hypothetical protein E5Q_06124 [Mixia osmundae IAM 14324]